MIISPRTENVQAGCSRQVQSRMAGKMMLQYLATTYYDCSHNASYVAIAIAMNVQNASLAPRGASNQSLVHCLYISACV